MSLSASIFWCLYSLLLTCPSNRPAPRAQSYIGIIQQAIYIGIIQKAALMISHVMCLCIHLICTAFSHAVLTGAGTWTAAERSNEWTPRDVIVGPEPESRVKAISLHIVQIPKDFQDKIPTKKERAFTPPFVVRAHTRPCMSLPSPFVAT